MAQGIILAAGYAHRAASNKMLFMIHGKTLIQHAVDGMRPWVSHIFVVTGHYDKDIRGLLKDDPMVTCVFNEHYEKGMFSSVQKGVFMIHESFFILPGDCPFVSFETYKILSLCQKSICVPSYHNHRGHPMFIDHKLKDDLLKEPPDSTLKDFRNRHPFQTIDVPDQNILIDIDTISDYDALKKQGGF